MKQPTFHGRVLLPLSVFAEARAGDPLAMERILRYYDGYMNKLCSHRHRLPVSHTPYFALSGGISPKEKKRTLIQPPSHHPCLSI